MEIEYEGNQGEWKKYQNTESVCPVCLKKIAAYRVMEGDRVYLDKECLEHGKFRTLIWNGLPEYESWARVKMPSYSETPSLTLNKGCPYDCGLCTEHRQKTCCVLLEVTKRCDLRCPLCFASAGVGAEEDLTLEEIELRFKDMMKRGGPFNIQLSGGEPGMRDDLPEIIELGRKIGFEFFQMNTNGIRIGRDKNYIHRLAEAGLNCVFLQFDGLRDEVYRKLRGKDLLEDKLAAIEACRREGIGVVLVPVIARGVNVDQIGKLLDFALEQMPVVRGVHFQPLSYFGRYEGAAPEERFTMPDLLREIEKQTNGRMKTRDFTPGNAENAYCSFSGNFIREKDGAISPWKNGKTTIQCYDTEVEESCCCGIQEHEESGNDSCSETEDTGVMESCGSSDKSRKFVARQWSAAPEESCCGENVNTASLDDFLNRLERQTLAVSCMVFMDAWNLDLERLKECYIHVSENRQEPRLIPFCAYNLTAADGTTLYRNNMLVEL